MSSLPTLPPYTPAPVAPAVIPEGYGCLVITYDGPLVERIPALHVGAVRVPIARGTWYVIVPVGAHELRAGDALGFTATSATRTVRPGQLHPVAFWLGSWTFQVTDEHGQDIATRRGLSHLWILPIGLALLLLLPAALMCLGALASLQH